MYVCVCVYVWLYGRKGEIDWEGETKWKTKSICASYVDAKRVCANAARGVGPKAVDVCVAEEKRRVLFPSSLSSSLPSTCQSYSISHPSIFHFYMQLQMWKQRNIKLQKRACICKNNPAWGSPLTWHTLSHTFTVTVLTPLPPPPVQENSAATLAPHCLLVFLSGLNVTKCNICFHFWLHALHCISQTPTAGCWGSCRSSCSACKSSYVLQSSVHWKVWKTKWFLMLFSDWIGMKMNSWKKRANIHENDCNNVMHSLLCVDRSDTSWCLFSSHQFSLFFSFFGSEKSRLSIFPFHAAR